MDRQSDEDIESDMESVIFLSDHSVASDNSDDNKSIIIGSTSESEDGDDVKDVVLREEKFTVTETVHVTEEVVKNYADKWTQTNEKEFPAPKSGLVQSPIQIDTTAPTTSGGNTVTNNVGKSTRTPIIYTTGQSTSASLTSSATKQTTECSQKDSDATRDKNPVISNSNTTTRRTYSHTRSYRNHRVQPYRRNNNNYRQYNDNYNNNYNNNNRSNYRRYDNNYSNNNRHNNGYYNNGYNTVGYNNNYYPDYRNNNFNNVQRYGNQYFTSQFKDRLFRGFVGLLDYVFDYNFAEDVYY